MTRHSSSHRLIRIVLISPSRIVGSGLRLLLETHRDFRLLGVGTSYADAVKVQRSAPDVILLHEEDAGGIEAEQGSPLRDAPKTARLVILTNAHNPETHRAVVRLGAMGVVRQQDPPETLFRAIERVHAGEVWLDHALVMSLLESGTGQPGPRDMQTAPFGLLTQREREVVRLVSEALHNRQIAQRLFISETTVRHHLTSIFDKLGVSSRLQLAKYAYGCGMGRGHDASIVA